MKKIICFLTLLTLNFNPAFAAGKVGEAFFETVVLGKSVRSRGDTAIITVVGKWVDGSEYQPLVFLTASPNTDKKGAELGQKAEALIDAAINSQKPMRFSRLFEENHSFLFSALSYEGTTIDLRTGTIETDEPGTVASASETNTKTNSAGLITEYQTQKFDPPTAFTDYTVQMDYIWGVSETKDKVQVFLDDRIQVTSVGPSEVIPKAVQVSAKFRDDKNSKTESFHIRFKGNVDYRKIQWCHIKSSHEVLAPLRDPILEKVRRGKAKPPMILKEVSFN